MEKAQLGWVILFIHDKCVASTFWWPLTLLSAPLVIVFVVGDAATDATRRPGLQTSMRDAGSPEFAADTAASTVWVL